VHHVVVARANRESGIVDNDCCKEMEVDESAVVWLFRAAFILLHDQLELEHLWLYSSFADACITDL